MIRYWMLAGMAVLVVAPIALARNPGLSRAEIRSMPITERPSRPGHFYGNAVRRNTSRAMESGRMAPMPGRVTPANAWQGYQAPAQPNAWIEGQPQGYVVYE